MAVAIPTLPMSGSALKTSLDDLRDHMTFKVGTMAGLTTLSAPVAGDRYLTPEGWYEVVAGLGATPGDTVIALGGGLQAVLTPREALRDVATVLADTRPPALLPEASVLQTRAEGHAYTVAAPTASDHHLTTAGGVKLYVQPGVKGFNVRAFGALGDGTTDDSAAFMAAFEAAVATRKTHANISNAVIEAAIYVPGGEYRIVSPRSLIYPVGGALRAVGLTYQGDGPHSHIVYAADSDDYLCYNNNEFLAVRFRGLTISCGSNLSKFLYSYGSGGAQDYHFEDVGWSGTWQKLFYLEGGNNNSEWKWDNCGITASIRDVVFEIPSTGSDQFLNYWFVNCKLWLYDGQMIRATWGGHFHFVNCDWSGLSPNMTLNASVNGAALFELLGSSHARGVCSLSVIGGRFEHKNTLSKLIFCQWPYGTVSFRDVDFLATYDASYDTVTHAEFRRAATSGPQVLFDNCQLMGQHKYFNAAGSPQFEGHAVYRQCMMQHAVPDDFLIMERASGVMGGTWLVDLQDCRGSSANNAAGQMKVWTAAIGSRYAMVSHWKPSAARFGAGNSQGTPLTTSQFRLQLPGTAVITRVTFRNAGDLTSAAVVNFRVTDAAGALIAQTGNQTLSAQWTVDASISHTVAAGQANLILEDANGIANQTASTLFVVVEFVC